MDVHARVLDNHLLDCIRYTGWAVMHDYGYDHRGNLVTCAVEVEAFDDVGKAEGAYVEVVRDGKGFGFGGQDVGRVFHVSAAYGAVHIPLEQLEQYNYDSSEKAQLTYVYKQVIDVPHPGMPRVHNWQYL